MKKVCFLTTDNLEGYMIDDDLAVGPLEALGISVESVSWHADRDWDEFDIVVIRTTWDYHYTPDKFLNFLERIDRSSASLENSLDLVRWNLKKTYLKDLAAQGITTVPTFFGGRSETITTASIKAWKREFDCERLVVKPAVSATARNTFLIDSFEDSLIVFEDSEFLVQPLMDRIMTEGEYSVFHFNGEFSHAVLKAPKHGDFRVQENFGGRSTPTRPNRELIGFSENLLKILDNVPLYARVDIVKNDDDELALMELELIEPALYFRYDKESATRFAACLNSRINEL